MTDIDIQTTAHDTMVVQGLLVIIWIEYRGILLDTGHVLPLTSF